MDSEREDSIGNLIKSTVVNVERTTYSNAVHPIFYRPIPGWLVTFSNGEKWIVKDEGEISLGSHIKADLVVRKVVREQE